MNYAYDFATRSGKKRALTPRNIRRIAERAIKKHPENFIKIIGDALGLMKAFYGLTTEDAECKNMIGRLYFAAKKQYEELEIPMPTPVSATPMPTPVKIDSEPFGGMQPEEERAAIAEAGSSDPIAETPKA